MEPQQGGIWRGNHERKLYRKSSAEDVAQQKRCLACRRPEYDPRPVTDKQKKKYET